MDAQNDSRPSSSHSRGDNSDGGRDGTTVDRGERNSPDGQRRRRDQGNYGHYITQRLSEIQGEMAYQRLDQKTVLQNVQHSHRQQEMLIEIVSGLMRDMAVLRAGSNGESCNGSNGVLHMAPGDLGAKPDQTESPLALTAMEAALAAVVDNALVPLTETLTRVETRIDCLTDRRRPSLPRTQHAGEGPGRRGPLRHVTSRPRSSGPSVATNLDKEDHVLPSIFETGLTKPKNASTSSNSLSAITHTPKPDESREEKMRRTSSGSDFGASIDCELERDVSGCLNEPVIGKGMSVMIQVDEDNVGGRCKNMRTLSLSLKPDSCGRRFIERTADFLDSFEEPKRTGMLARVVQARWFENLTACVIIANAVCVAFTSNYEIQHIGQPTPQSFVILELCFLAYYFIELSLRIIVHKFYFFAFGADIYWNLFDFVLVLLSLQDAYFTFRYGGVAQAELASNAEDEDGGSNFGFMRIFRLAKLAKILRAVRVIRVFRELSTILDSFKKSAVSLFWCFVMLAFVLYVFALVFLQGLAAHLATDEVSNARKTEGMKMFGSVPTAMRSLYMAVTGGNDWYVYYDVIRECGEFFDVAFLFFTFFFIFALFNILTGIFVEKSVAAGQPDRDELIMQQCRKSKKEAEEFRILCRHFDRDRTGTISFDEFVECMQNERMVSYMASVGLEIHDVEMFFKIVAGAGDNEEVNIDRFVEGCMSMKGQATGLDMQRELFQTVNLCREVKELDESITARFQEVTGLMNKTLRRVNQMGGFPQVDPISRGETAKTIYPSDPPEETMV